MITLMLIEAGQLVALLCMVATVVMMRRAERDVRKSIFEYGVACGAQVVEAHPGMMPEYVLAAAWEKRRQIDEAFAKERKANRT